MIYTKLVFKLPHVSGSKVDFSLFTPHYLGKTLQLAPHSQATTPTVAQEALKQEMPEKSPLPKLCKLDPPEIEERVEQFG